MSNRYSLPRNKRVSWPTHTILFDLETTPKQISPLVDEHPMRLGQACYLRWRVDRNKWQEEWQFIRNEDTLVVFIEDHAYNNQKLFVASHNLGFDAEVVHLVERLEEHNWDVKSPIVTSNTVIIKLRQENRTIELFSTTNIWHCSLDALGKAHGIPKHEMPDWSASDDEWAAYCRRDVEVLVVAFKAWLERLRNDNLGGFSPTIAATGMRAFRHAFMRHEIVIDHTPSTVELERAAYHGGRTKVYFQGHLPPGTYYDLDIKSAYPSIMASRPLPYRLAWRGQNIPVRELQGLLDEYSVIARVRVETNEPVFPLAYNGHIIYPLGMFVTTLTTPELKYALAHNFITQVHKYRAYNQAVLFKEFVEYFFTDRLEAKARGDQVRADQDKRILNSLSGKWGGKIHALSRSTGSDALAFGINTVVHKSHEERIVLRRVGLHAWREEEEREAPYSFPGIIGHITAYCRMRLWEYQKLIGGEHYYKEETDGFLTDEVGVEQVRGELGENGLGKLTVSDVYHDVIIYAPNDYVLDGGRVTKGVKKDAEEITPGVYRQIKFPTLLGRTRNPPYTPYRTYWVEKRLNRTVQDGTVGEDGWVQPLEMSELNPDLLYKR